MNQVIPKYIPRNSLEDKFGFLVTAVGEDGKRVYLSRGGFQWGPIADAEFFDDPLNAADSIHLTKVTGIMVPTVISPQDLKKRRREAALKKLTEDEIEALGVGAGPADDKPAKRRT